jgi:hypothetical protein
VGEKAKFIKLGGALFSRQSEAVFFFFFFDTLKQWLRKRKL